jgi:hypothetical protein
VIKDFLAFLGLMFLTVVILLGVAVVGYLYGFLDLIPQQMMDTTSALVDRIRGPVEVRVSDAGVGEVTWSNPLEALPTATVWRLPTLPAPTATPIPIPTQTAVPPMDPALYRTEVTLQLKQYVGALERWLEANRQVGADNALLRDQTWRSNMLAVLDEIAAGGRAMAAIGPPPVEYQGVHMLLVQIGQSSEQLRASYSRALESGAPLDFRQAGDEFTRIKAYLTEAVTAMVALGWTIEP